MPKKKTKKSLRETKQRVNDTKSVKVVAFLYAVLALLPIIWTPLTADDIPNSGARIGLIEQPGNFFYNYFSYFFSHTKQWIDVEGRFFPGATFYGITTHAIFQGVGVYKLFLFAISLTLFILLYQVISRVLPFNIAILGTLFALSGYSLRYRYFHDGISSFAGQVPFAGVLFLISLLLLIDNKLGNKKYTFPISIFAFVFAALIYEHIATFIPGVIIFLALNSPKVFVKRNVISFSILLILQFILTLSLRSGVKAGVAYTLDFQSTDFVRTAYRQLVSPLPMSQYLFAQADFLGAVERNYLQNNLAWILTLSASFLAISLRAFQRLSDARIEKEKSAKCFSVFALGLNMALVPSLLTGATVRWQSEIPGGQGYLCVVLQSVGLGLMVASLLVLFQSFQSMGARRRGTLAVVVLFAFLISQNIAWNWGFNY